MSGVKHTPGPWLTQWEHGGDESIWSRDGGMHMIATCHAEDDRVIPAQANARLIAAAPDLLAVAKLALKTILDEAAARDFDPPADPVLVAELEAAIARARGEQDGGGE